MALRAWHCPRIRLGKRQDEGTRQPRRRRTNGGRDQQPRANRRLERDEEQRRPCSPLVDSKAITSTARQHPLCVDVASGLNDSPGRSVDKSPRTRFDRAAGRPDARSRILHRDRYSKSAPLAASLCKEWARAAVDDPGNHQIAAALNTKPKYLASTTLTEPRWANTTLLSGDLAAAIGELKAKPAGELQVHGSGALIRWLLENDLVDEINLLIVSVVLGQGTRLFPDAGPDIALDLVDSRADSKGVTIQVYRPTGAPAVRNRHRRPRRRMTPAAVSGDIPAGALGRSVTWSLAIPTARASRLTRRCDASRDQSRRRRRVEWTPKRRRRSPRLSGPSPSTLRQRVPGSWPTCPAEVTPAREGIRRVGPVRVGPTQGGYHGPEVFRSHRVNNMALLSRLGRAWRVRDDHPQLVGRRRVHDRRRPALPHPALQEPDRLVAVEHDETSAASGRGRPAPRPPSAARRPSSARPRGQRARRRAARRRRR